jgi:hypothetical protein
MADKIKLVDGTDPPKPGAFYLKGTDAMTPEGMQAIFERLKGRPATPGEIAVFQEPIGPNGRALPSLGTSFGHEAPRHATGRSGRISCPRSVHRQRSGSGKRFASGTFRDKPLSA